MKWKVVKLQATRGNFTLEVFRDRSVRCKDSQWGITLYDDVRNLCLTHRSMSATMPTKREAMAYAREVLRRSDGRAIRSLPPNPNPVKRGRR